MFTGIWRRSAPCARRTRGDVVAVTIEARPVARRAAAGRLRRGERLLPDRGRRWRRTRFACELTAETLRAHVLRPGPGRGARVNLERPLRADGRFDGHIVQGHVDGVGRVLALRRQGRSAELEVAPPAALERYLVEKGSVAVDGVSLTVAGLRAGAFSVALIPYTLERTTLATLRPGDPVNLEADVIAKYVERLLQPRGSA